ncbi:MAG: hypothetical protein P9M14_10930 [Candidatus Alcyoniella australis]|nr:hypothetical protein [Candidatus Alcyoniella australis]
MVSIQLPRPTAVPLIAIGGDLKCRPALADGGMAHVADEIGDLADPDNQDALEDFVEQHRPAGIVRDAHPGYFSSMLAQRIADERGIELITVQHHRAHVAAVCLEHGLYHEPVVGLAFDGTGFGDDGTAWGGELFSGSLDDGLVRRAHFAPLPLPGGDAAIRQPWRIALALLLERGMPHDTIEGWLALRKVDPGDLDLLLRSLTSDMPMARSTSLGRWFDAVSALLGVRTQAQFEAQPAIDLQNLAQQQDVHGLTAQWPFRVESNADGLLQIDFPNLVQDALSAPEHAPELAAAFHVAAAQATASVAIELAAQASTDKVLAAGGCFLNSLFEGLLVERLHAAGLQYLKSNKLPVGDQAIALGQIGLALNHEPLPRDKG